MCPYYHMLRVSKFFPFYTLCDHIPLCISMFTNNDRLLQSEAHLSTPVDINRIRSESCVFGINP